MSQHLILLFHAGSTPRSRQEILPPPSNTQVRFLTLRAATPLAQLGPAFPSCSLALASLLSPARLRTRRHGLPTQSRLHFLNSSASRLDPCLPPAPLPAKARRPARPRSPLPHARTPRSVPLAPPLPRSACLRTSAWPSGAKSSSPRPPSPHAHAPWPVPFLFVAPPA